MDVLLFKPSFFLFLLISLLLLCASPAQENPRTGAAVVAHPSPPPPPARYSQFMPSIAVIVGVLTTVFSITFLLLLYAKHCKGAGAGAGDRLHLNSSSSVSAAGRKDSGVDRAVVESLPVFRFGSLSGHNKDGLECAVCLNRFEGSEVLRLLPKCKHAFHVECVDTWLDAHSTCPLCRYRVDPEDILLLDARPEYPDPEDVESGATKPNPVGFFARVSGRHSSAGERGFQAGDTASYRMSLDSWSWRRKKDSSPAVKPAARKDGLLLNRARRLEHRIVVSGPQYKRWSDVQPSDLLYLRSEMIMSDSRRFSSASGSRPLPASWCNENREMNSRSVSEITGMRRFTNDNNGENDTETRQRQRQQAGLLSRWIAWVSQLRPPNTQQHIII